jgi:hypothetical protein
MRKWRTLSGLSCCSHLSRPEAQNESRSAPCTSPDCTFCGRCSGPEVWGNARPSRSGNLALGRFPCLGAAVRLPMVGSRKLVRHARNTLRGYTTLRIDKRAVSFVPLRLAHAPIPWLPRHGRRRAVMPPTGCMDLAVCKYPKYLRVGGSKVTQQDYCVAVRFVTLSSQRGRRDHNWADLSELVPYH